jgi:hypothetical protein
MLLDLEMLPRTLKILGNVKAINYFLKLSNLALAEGLTTEEVVQLLNIVRYDPLSSVEKRMEEVKRMLLCLETELDEKEDLLNHHNKKAASAISNLKVWKRACKEEFDEFMRIHNEKQSLTKWVYEFKHNDGAYLEVQNVVKDRVNAFLTEYDGRKLLEFALAAAAEALKLDPSLIERMVPLKNYDYDPEKLFFPNPYDYSDVNKEMTFELSSEIYNKLIKGLTDVTISRAAGLPYHESPLRLPD